MELLRKYRQIIENFFSLSILNGLNVLLPLVTLPYILRVIGAEKYGMYAYVYVVIQYIILIATYGFNFSATKQISQSRDDVDYVNIVYNAVTLSKLLIAIIVSAVVFALSRFIFKSEIETMMFLLGLGMVFGDIFTPIWLFQGMEKMKYITIVNAVSKILFTILVFIVIKSADDFYLLILLNSIGYLMAGLLSVILANKQFNLRLRFAPIKDVCYQLKDGAAVFGSTLGMNLYRNANILILKQFVPDAVVGIYAAAEKVVKGFQSLINPAAQALFPHFSLQFKEKNNRERVALLKRVTLPFAGIVAGVAALVFLFAPQITKILCGAEFFDSVVLVRWMVAVIFFGEINYMIGIVGLINMNRKTYFFIAVLITGVFSVAFLLLTVQNYGALAAAWTMSLSEILLCILCLLGFYKIKER